MFVPAAVGRARLLNMESPSLAGPGAAIPVGIAATTVELGWLPLDGFLLRGLNRQRSHLVAHRLWLSLSGP